VREHDKSRPGETVGIRAAAIIGLPEPGERRGATVGTVGNLLLAEELEVTVIVQGDDARQPGAAFAGSEDESLRPRAEPDGPRDLFTADAVRHPRAADTDVLGLLVGDGEAETLLRPSPTLAPRDGRLPEQRPNRLCSRNQAVKRTEMCVASS
jgi:hypothetical protein